MEHFWENVGERGAASALHRSLSKGVSATSDDFLLSPLLMHLDRFTDTHETSFGVHNVN
jgi:hypothetical protein